RGGSPLEKATVTEPLSNVFPQSSLTSTANATGQPAETAKESFKLVKEGTSLPGVHAVLSANDAAFLPFREGAENVMGKNFATTNTFKPTSCRRPSEKLSSKRPL